MKKKEIVMLVHPSLHQEIKEAAKNYNLPIATWCRVAIKNAIIAEKPRR